jgi:hypothetical protein
VRLQVTEAGADIEYDCGRGTIDEPLVLDEDGTFRARGHHTPERGGPVRDDSPPARAADYTGHVRGSRMQLTVTIDGEDDPFGTFALTHGSDVVLRKCR